MRLGIDAREIQDGVHTGIGRPLVNFLRYFAGQNNDDRCILFSARRVPIDFGPRISNVVRPEMWRQYWDQVQLPYAARQQRIDLFYSPYYKHPLLLSCPRVCAVFDLMYLIWPEYRRQLNPLARLYYATLGRRYVQAADRILTCSEFSKKDIIEYYKINPEKITVIPLSVAGLYRPETDSQKIETMRSRYGIDGPYLLYVGNFKVHKNVERIIRAFHRIAGDFADLKLVLAGPREHLYERLKALADQLSLSDRVIFTGTIQEKDEPHVIYSGAQAFVMPSLYEGFGLPPVEAMACGVPVIASATTSMPEVVRDAGVLVDPLNVEAIALAVRLVLTDERRRDDLVAQGLRYAADYEETRIAARQYEFFKDILRR